MPKILIVDDDPDIVDSVKLILGAEGYQVVSADNRADGMKAVDAERPDLVILDVMMEQPDDGFVVAQDLRRKGHNGPIMILTSIGQVTGYKYGKDSEMAPVDEFVTKPVAPSDLLAKVKSLLRQ
jgi:DNA-binding response OmpR family regulator